MLKRLRYHLLVLGCVAVAACADFGPIVLDMGDCWMDCGWTPGGTNFALSPLSAHILRGDTVSFLTWHCDGGYLCGSQGNVLSRWSITGNAAAVVIDSDTTRSVALAREIVVRGMAVGRSLITAAAASDSTQTTTVPVTVADSSVITEVSLRTFARPDSVRQSAQFFIYAQLRDAEGTLYRGQPSEWTISDSTVARLTSARFGDGTLHRVLVPLAPGTIVVTARFLDLVATLQVTVLP